MNFYLDKIIARGSPQLTRRSRRRNEIYFRLCVIKGHQVGQHNCRVEYKRNHSSWFVSSDQQMCKQSISRFTSSGIAFRFYPCVAADTERLCERSIQFSIFLSAEGTAKFLWKKQTRTFHFYPFTRQHHCARKQGFMDEVGCGQTLSVHCRQYNTWNNCNNLYIHNHQV